jgi:hypothetical protein
MTEQNQNPEDTEGHIRAARAAGTDDVEGLDSMADDTEGHRKFRRGDDIGDEDDTEGHGLRHGVRGDMEHTEGTEHTEDGDDDARGHGFRHG